MLSFIRKWIGKRQQKKLLEQMPPRPFVDTPEAWDARRVIPGETREQARTRLAKYRRTDG